MDSPRLEYAFGGKKMTDLGMAKRGNVSYHLGALER